MKLKHIVLAGAMLLFGTVATILPTKLNAQFSVGGTPFQTTVPVNINNFNWTTVAIPAGFRLTVQSISISGEAQAPGEYVQPIVILNASLNGGASNLYYYAPPVSTVDPTQYYLNQQTTVYADSLLIGPAFAGYDPFSLSFNVAISGYLTKIPK